MDDHPLTGPQFVVFNACYASRLHPQPAPRSLSPCRLRTSPVAAGCAAGRRSPFQSAVASESGSAAERSRRR